MEGKFITFALEGSSAASTVTRKTRRKTTQGSSEFVPWNQPPTRLGPLPCRKSAPNSQNSIRAYPTPETPSNTVEMEVENVMEHADGWDTPYEMHNRQRNLGDVSML